MMLSFIVRINFKLVLVDVDRTIGIGDQTDDSQQKYY